MPRLKVKMEVTSRSRNRTTGDVKITAKPFRPNPLDGADSFTTDSSNPIAAFTVTAQAGSTADTYWLKDTQWQFTIDSL